MHRTYGAEYKNVCFSGNAGKKKSGEVPVYLPQHRKRGNYADVPETRT